MSKRILYRDLLLLHYCYFFSLLQLPQFFIVAIIPVNDFAPVFLCAPYSKEINEVRHFFNEVHTFSYLGYYKLSYIINVLKYIFNNNT